MIDIRDTSLWRELYCFPRGTGMPGSVLMSTFLWVDNIDYITVTLLIYLVLHMAIV
jgi:hypothetical protein